MLLARVALVAIAMLPFGCRTAQTSGTDVKVINGIEAEEGQMAYVVRLSMVKASGGTSSCSGAFINSSVVLTASHCLVDRDAGYIKLAANKVSVGGVTAKALILAASDYPSKYQTAMTLSTDDARWEMVRRDTALVIFPQGTAQSLGIPLAKLKRLKKTQPTVDTEIFIMGFGLADDDDPYSGGVKRWGASALSYVGSTILYYPSASGSTPGANSGAAAGDSGGPLLERSTQTLIGVTSWGFNGNEYAPSLRNTYALNLFAASNAAGNELIDY